MSSRTKIAIIMGAVAVVILSVVLGVVLVKGTPDLGKIRDDLERNSIASVSFKSETTTKTPETTTSALTNPTETSTLPVQVSTSTYLPQTVPSSSAVTIGNKVYLTSVSVYTLPNKTSYYIGDSFSVSGLSVSARYSDGTSRIVSGNVDNYPDMSYAGQRTVSVSYSDSYGNKKYDNFSITVKSPSVSLYTSSLYLDVGETYNLSSSSEPSNCTVTWKSSSPNTVWIDNTGKVTALKAGTASITASITYNGRTYTSSTCYVTVSAPQTTATKSTLSIKGMDTYTWYCSDDVMWFTDFDGYIISNYELDYVCIGIEGPVYVNGRYDTIDQYYTFDRDEINSTRFDLCDYICYLDFDYIDGEDYTFYIYAEDVSENSVYDEWEITLDY